MSRGTVADKSITDFDNQVTLVLADYFASEDR